MDEKKIEKNGNKIKISEDSIIDKMIYSMKFGDFLIKFEISLN